MFEGYEPLPVKPARTWFLAEGWRKYGPISLYDVPGTFEHEGRLISLRSPHF